MKDNAAGLKVVSCFGCEVGGGGKVGEEKEKMAGGAVVAAAPQLKDAAGLVGAGTGAGTGAAAVEKGFFGATLLMGG